MWARIRQRQAEANELQGDARVGAQITIDSLTRRMPNLPEEKKQLCIDYHRVAEPVLTDLRWAPRITTRDDLFNTFLRRRIDACLDNGEDRVYIEMAFGQLKSYIEQTRNEVVDFLEGLVHKMTATKNAEMVVINNEEVSFSETFLRDYLRDFFNKYPLQWNDSQVDLKDRISAVMYAIDDNTKAKEGERYLPIIKVGQRFEFDIPEEFQYVLALKILEQTDLTDERTSPLLYTKYINWDFSSEAVLAKLDAVNCFKNGRYKDFRFLLSAIGEIIYDDRSYRATLIDFLTGVTERIGGRDPVEMRKGFAFARTILDDFAKYYVKDSRESIEYRFLEQTREALNQREREYFYPDRKPVVPADVMEQAVSAMERRGPSAMNEAIWLGMVPEGSVGALFPPEMREQIELIIQYALKRRKAEAAIIPGTADVYGADSEEAIWIMKLKQAFIGAMFAKDDGYDIHLRRDNEPTLQVTEGPTDASERALLMILNVINEIVKIKATDNRLALGVSEMMTAVYYGDVASRSLCWDKERKRYVWENPKFLEQYEKAERAIAGIFAWYPLYAGEVTGFPESGALWAEANRDYGYLILVANDMEDILIRGKYKKHEMGNDIGQKPSIYQWLFMHLELPEDDSLSASLVADQEIVRKAYDDIGRKRHAGEKLNDVDYQQIAQACEALTKYAPRIIPQMQIMLEPFYTRARESLAEAFKKLPSMDRRNTTQQIIFENMIDGVWQKICGFSGSGEEAAIEQLFQVREKVKEEVLE